MVIFVFDRIAGHNVREKHRLTLRAIQLRRWREVKPNDAQELSEERFHDEVFWQVVRCVLINKRLVLQPNR